MSCRNHGYPVKHTLEDSDLIKCYLKGNYKTTGLDALFESVDNEGKRDACPNPKECLMIFGRPKEYEASTEEQPLGVRTKCDLSTW